MIALFATMKIWALKWVQITSFIINLGSLGSRDLDYGALIGFLVQFSTSSSVVQENTATLFCCEAPEMSAGVLNRPWLSNGINASR